MNQHHATLNVPEPLSMRKNTEGKIAKKGFVVELRIFDRKIEKDILKWDKMCIEDLEKLDAFIQDALKKFK